MSQPVKLTDELVLEARSVSQIAERSIAGQIEYWAQLGRAIDPILRGDRALALKRAGENRSLAEAISTVDSNSGRKRVSDYLEQTPFPHFEPAPDSPGLLWKIDEDGTRGARQIRQSRVRSNRELMDWKALLDERPIVVAVAGSNGAGKTTFYQAHLAETGLRFVNADELALELGIGAYEAAEMADALRRALVERGESFVFETVLSDPAGQKVEFLKETGARGYQVALIFIRIDSVATSKQRVAIRLMKGGHDVPDEKLETRFDRTLANLKTGNRVVAVGHRVRQLRPPSSLPAGGSLSTWRSPIAGVNRRNFRRTNAVLTPEPTQMKSDSSLNRRHFLSGAGVSMLLPQLESLSAAAGAETIPPKRFLALYVGHGFAITLKDDHPARDWSWYPRVVDGKLKFGTSMAAMQPFADQISVFHGLEHPQVVKTNGHSSADSFLTGSNPEGAVVSPSIDQVAAMTHGKATRYPSLVLGNEGGLGATGSSLTLSYNRSGRAIPSTSNLTELYNRLFNSDPAIIRKEKALYERNGTLVDRVLDSAKSLQRRVSADDNRKIGSYLESIRAVEKNIERMEAWSDTPKPEVDTSSLSLKATVNEPGLFVETMYDLIYLAFKTDSTRYATYMLQSMIDGPWNEMPKNVLGLPAGHHRLAHSAAGAGAKAMEYLGTFDKFHGDQLGKFLTKMADTPEGEGSMLDNTIVFYGTSNSKTHVNRDYPLMFAGGRNLGLKQGVFHDMATSSAPLSNLFLTFLRQLDVPAENFSDSTGVMDQVLA